MLPNIRITRNHRDADSAIKCVFMHQQVEGQPSKESRKNGDSSAVALFNSSRQLGYVCQDLEPPTSSSIVRKGTKVLAPTRKVKFSFNALRHIETRDQGPLLLRRSEKMAKKIKKKESQKSESAG